MACARHEIGWWVGSWLVGESMEVGDVRSRPMPLRIAVSVSVSVRLPFGLSDAITEEPSPLTGPRELLAG